MRKNYSHNSGLHLFNLFGFEVRLDWSWIFLAILVSWTLAVGYFPVNFPNQTVNTYWMMGVIGAIGLFLSIIFHEVCHSLVGRYYGVSITGITLFIFGGIAKMPDDPPNPKVELLMSIAGPLFSLVLAVALNFIFQIGVAAEWPTSVNGVIGYLSTVNFVVGVFNLFPGFPLDGGRVLRSILWWWKGDLKWATLIACRCGVILSFTMIFIGIMLIVQEAIIAGLWMFLLGFFLQHLSKMSYQDLIIKEAFHRETIKKYVKTDPITVPRNSSLQELVDNYFYKYYHKFYPVIENDALVGCISLSDVTQIPKEKWSELQVKDVMHKCSPNTSIDAETAIVKVIQMMNSQQISRLIVTDHGKLYGVIGLKDLMDAITIKLSLNEKDIV